MLNSTAEAMASTVTFSEAPLELVKVIGPAFAWRPELLLQPVTVRPGTARHSRNSRLTAP